MRQRLLASGLVKAGARGEHLLEAALALALLLDSGPPLVFTAIKQVLHAAKKATF